MKALRVCSLCLVFIIALWVPFSHAGWTPPVRISDEALAYDPRIVANGDALHVVYWTWTGTARSYYLRSLDGGDLWQAPFRLGDSLILGSENSPLVQSVGDTVATIWHQNLPGGAIQSRIPVFSRWRRNLGGVTYVLPSDSYQLQKHAFDISDGKTYLIYSRSSQGIIVEFTKSTDWGESWAEPTEVFRTQETGSVDMAVKGDTIHFVWVGRFNYDNRWEIYHIRSTNGGDSWSENNMLSTPDDRGSNWPSISINSIGNISVSWMDYKYTDNFWTGDLFVRYSFDSGESWTDEEQLTFAHGVWSTRILWQEDSVHVAYEDWRYSQQDIFYRLSTDNGITWGEEQRVEDDPGESGYPDLAYAGNSVHLVWNDFREDPGYGIYYSRWEEEVGTDDGHARLPDKLNLAAYPNPFNSSTIITYNELEGGEIEIYNIFGQKIKTLKTTAKEGKIIWDARDALGNKVSSGIYFARARNNTNSIAIKLLYLK